MKERIAAILLVVLMLFSVFVKIGHDYMVETKYLKALALCQRQQYDEAIALFTEIQYYKDAKDFIIFIQEMKLQ